MGRKSNHQKRYENNSAPTKYTPEVIALIEEAAGWGASYDGIAIHANINPSTLYRWFNEYPNLKERLELLANTPSLNAIRNTSGAIKSGNLSLSQWQLERRDPKYMPQSKVDMNAKVDMTDESEIERSPEELKALADLRAARIKRIKQNIKDAP